MGDFLNSARPTENILSPINPIEYRIVAATLPQNPVLSELAWLRTAYNPPNL